MVVFQDLFKNPEPLAIISGLFKPLQNTSPVISLTFKDCGNLSEGLPGRLSHRTNFPKTGASADLLRWLTSPRMFQAMSKNFEEASPMNNTRTSRVSNMSLKAEGTFLKNSGRLECSSQTYQTSLAYTIPFSKCHSRNPQEHVPGSKISDSQFHR